MREILYRAISLCRGEGWVYGQPRHYARNPHTEKWTIYDSITGIETDIGEETLGQYTGLTDKSGNKIFEGDIIAVDKIKGNIKKCVRYDVELGMWKADRTEGSAQDFELYVFADLGCVIGNIHDNPELLKGGDQ